MKFAVRTATGLVLSAMLVACASTRPAEAPSEWDGLVRRESRRVDQLYVRPGVKIGPFTSVMIDAPEVAFDRNWDPNRDQRELARRVMPEDLARIKAGLAQMLNDTFARALSAGGYRVVTEAGPDTLRISPAIVDLYINAPEFISPGRTHTLTMEAGRMTLVAEFRDAASGQLLARAVDREQGTYTGQLQITNSVTNSAEAQRAISSWARTLVKGLDGLKESAP